MDLRSGTAIQVEDIVDTGYTTSQIMNNLNGAGAASCALVTLLNKRSRRVVDVDIALQGFEVSRFSPSKPGLEHRHTTPHASSIATCQFSCIVSSVLSQRCQFLMLSMPDDKAIKSSAAFPRCAWEPAPENGRVKCTAIGR